MTWVAALALFPRAPVLDVGHIKVSKCPRRLSGRPQPLKLAPSGQHVPPGPLLACSRFPSPLARALRQEEAPPSYRSREGCGLLLALAGISSLTAL